MCHSSPKAGFIEMKKPPKVFIGGMELLSVVFVESCLSLCMGK